MRTCIRLLPVAAAFFQVGCFYIGDFGESDAYKQDIHKTVPLNAGGTVSVETFNGSIELIGWEQNSVEVNATKYASTQAAVDDIRIDVTPSSNSVHVRAYRPADAPWHRMGARFSIRVPHNVVLDLISTSNGAVRLENIEGRARLRTSNGSIRAFTVKGDLEARTSNGAVEIESLDGNGIVHTSNGSIRAEVSHGSFEAGTTNGSINARLADVAANRPVTLESTNGHIDLTLNGRETPDVRASTTNSSIQVRLPTTANARVRAHTSHNNVTSEFDQLQPDREDRRHHDLEGTIGRGGSLIDLSTSNGSIKILKL